MHSKASYVVYKRLRPAFGLAFGFTLMYGISAGGINMSLLLAGMAFIFIETFGGLYNDYWDYEEDMRNRRTDKLTTSGVLGREGARNLSYVLAGIGLSISLMLGIWLFALGLYWIAIFVLYCIPQVRLKGHVRSYLLASSIFFFFPFALSPLIGAGFSPLTLLLAAFFFAQFMYILCQKDSTDPADRKNIFIRHGWRKAGFLTAFFAALSSLFLLLLCIGNPVLLAAWIFNLAAKAINVNKILHRSINRKSRYRLVLMEFLTPYVYIVGMAL